MYNLLIVDDEPIITDMLYDLFSDLKEPEFSVIKAYSGYEALDWLKRTRVDIVLSDISMPGMNGLELQKEIRRLWPQCKVIFLTGYNEFDYVQAAIRNDGMDYVLKTEGEEAILEAVQRAVQEIEREASVQWTLDRVKMEMQLAIPLIRGKYLQDLLDGFGSSVAEVEKHFEILEVPLDFHIPVLMLVGRVDAWPQDSIPSERMKTTFGIQSIVEKHLGQSAAVTPILYEKTKLIWFIQPLASAAGTDNTETQPDWSSLVLYVNGMLGSIQRACMQVLNAPVSFILTGRPVSWYSLSGAYDSLLLTLNRETGLGNERLLLLHDAADGDSPDGQDVLRAEYEVRSQLKKIGLLQELLENNSREGFFQLYSQIMEVVGRSRFTPYDSCMEAFHSLSALFLSYINRWKLFEKLSKKVELEKLARVEWHSAWGEVDAYFRELAECIFEQKSDESFKNANRVFGFIKTYTEENLGSDLSLTRFAELLHFHPFYLSRLFKQVTGKSLTEYVTGVKAVKAKELLKESNRKIIDIATELGFDTASYFTRFFKKYTGVTPQEYRNGLVEGDKTGLQ